MGTTPNDLTRLQADDELLRDLEHVTQADVKDIRQTEPDISPQRLREALVLRDKGVKTGKLVDVGNGVKLESGQAELPAVYEDPFELVTTGVTGLTEGFIVKELAKRYGLSRLGRIGLGSGVSALSEFARQVGIRDGEIQEDERGDVLAGTAIAGGFGGVAEGLPALADLIRGGGRATQKTTQKTAQGMGSEMIRKASQLTGLDERLIEPLDEIAGRQRGVPERLMTEYQTKIGGGVMGHSLEHTGDLLHRMTNDIRHGDDSFGRRTVLDKVTRVLNNLESGYGFLKEHNENIANNARYFGMDPDELGSVSDDILEKYARSYEDIAVYNEPQKLAKNAAVSLGRKDVAEATKNLRKLKELAEDEELYKNAQRSIKFDEQGNIVRADLPEGLTEGSAKKGELPDEQAKAREQVKQTIKETVRDPEQLKNSPEIQKELSNMSIEEMEGLGLRFSNKEYFKSTINKIRRSSITEATKLRAKHMEELVNVSEPLLRRGITDVDAFGEVVAKQLGEEYRPISRTIFRETARKINKTLPKDKQIPIPDAELQTAFKHMHGPNEAIELIQDVASGKMVQNAKGGVRTLQEAQVIAKRLYGDNIEAIFKGRLTDSQVIAMMDLLEKYATHASDSVRDLVEADTSKNIGKFLHDMTGLEMLMTHIRGEASEAARALRAFGYFQKTLDYERNIDDITEFFGGWSRVRDIIQRIHQVDLNDPMFVARLAKAVRKEPSTVDKIYAYWINGLLSGPTTHGINILSGMFNMAEKLFIENPLAATLDAVRVATRGGQRQVFFTDTFDELAGMWAAGSEANRTFMETLQYEIPRFSGSKLEEISQRFAMKGKFGKAVRLPGTFLGAADDWMKTFIYRGNLYRNAMREARGLGLQGEQLRAHVANLVDHPSADMMEEALKEANYRTFTKALQGNLRKFSQIKQLPGVRWFLPFMRIALNGTTFALERTPFNAIRVGNKVIRGGGFETAEETARQVAKGTIGMSIGLGAYYGVKSGIITGGGPTDRNERASWYDAGNTPYTIQTPLGPIQYSRIEGIGGALALMAEAVEYFERDEADENSTAGVMFHLFSRFIAEKQFLLGLNDFFRAVNDPNYYGEQWAARFLSGFLPYSSATRTIRRADDPVFRRGRDVNESIFAAIPELSKKVPAMRDKWGQPIVDLRPGWERATNPLRRFPPEKKHVQQLARELGWRPNLPPKRIGNIMLQDDEWGPWVEKAGKEALNKIEEYMLKPGFVRLTPNGQLEIMKNIRSVTFRKHKLRLRKKVIERLRKDGVDDRTIIGLLNKTIDELSVPENEVEHFGFVDAFNEIFNNDNPEED